MIDPSLVEEVARRNKFQRENIVEQALCMLDVLNKISEDPDLRRELYLIGGTAINLFSKKGIPRLSVDIDMDYVQIGKGKFSEQKIDTHRDILSRIAGSLNMEPSWTEPKDDSKNKLKGIFTFKSNFDPSGEGNVKLDILYLLKSAILPAQKANLVQMEARTGFDKLTIKIADKHELWAGKALAAVYKSTKDPYPQEVADFYSMFLARHLFDLAKIEIEYKNNLTLFDLEKMLNCFIIKGVPRMKDFFMLRADSIRKCSKNEAEKQLYPYIKQEDRMDLKEMKREAREFLDRICGNNWQNNQKEFVKAFQEHGEYKPEILFGDKNKKWGHLFGNEYLIMSARRFKK